MDRSQEQDTILQARVEEAVRQSVRTSTPHFIGFLDARQAQVAEQAAQQAGCRNYLLWGGHPEAERVFFGAFPDWQEPDVAEFPICGATAHYRACDVLTHRDFLGAFLATGISREVLGDFLLEAGRCVFYFRREVADFLFAQIAKIGRIGVKLSHTVEKPLPQMHHFQRLEAVIAAPRLDCVTAACTGLSRKKAADLIAADAVQVDHQSVHACAYTIKEGALLSIRGKGRFVIDSVSQPTKKGRLRLMGRKFI